MSKCLPPVSCDKLEIMTPVDEKNRQCLSMGNSAGDVYKFWPVAGRSAGRVLLVISKKGAEFNG